MIKHIKIIVKGRVQGVWFRVNTKQKANELGLNGIVKNLADGSVYIEAEGTRELLNLFLNWCIEGPPLAHVSEVEKEYGYLKNYNSFNIL